MRTSLSIICVAAVILSGCGMADLLSSMLKQEGVTAATTPSYKTSYGSGTARLNGEP